LIFGILDTGIVIADTGAYYYIWGFFEDLDEFLFCGVEILEYNIESNSLDSGMIELGDEVLVDGFLDTEHFLITLSLESIQGLVIDRDEGNTV
jgi:hypothetical protein